MAMGKTSRGDERDTQPWPRKKRPIPHPPPHGGGRIGEGGGAESIPCLSVLLIDNACFSRGRIWFVFPLFSCEWMESGTDRLTVMPLSSLCRNVFLKIAPLWSCYCLGEGVDPSSSASLLPWTQPYNVSTIQDTLGTPYKRHFKWRYKEGIK